MDSSRHTELKNVNYELFILSLTVLSLLNIILGVFLRDPSAAAVVVIVELLISAILMGDFCYRLFSARSKRRYFIRQYGWLDLIGSLPVYQLRIARLGRVFRAVRLMKTYGLRPMIRDFLADRAQSALLVLGLIIILGLEFGSIGMLAAEKHAPDANIRTAGDAIWYVIITVSTVGYGDYLPVTTTGRVIGVLIIVTGVGLFAVLTAYLAQNFLGGSPNVVEPPQPADDGLETVRAELKELRSSQQSTSVNYDLRLANVEDLLRQILERTPKA